MGTCKWCHGTGRNHIEDSLYCRCEDCEGTGFIEECDICGEEYTGEYCEDCYAECKECGAVCDKDDLENGLCEDCAEAANE